MKAVNTSSKLPFSLDVIGVASPCDAAWEDMRGDEQVRFCGQCEKNVYNLSAMSREAAEQLVAQREGRMCIRFFRRQDGTLLTADCPVGWRAKLHQKARRWAASVIAGISCVATSLGCGQWENPFSGTFKNTGNAIPQGMYGPVAGEMCVPPQAIPVQNAPIEPNIDDSLLTPPEDKPALPDAPTSEPAPIVNE